MKFSKIVFIDAPSKEDAINEVRKDHGSKKNFKIISIFFKSNYKSWEVKFSYETNGVGLYCIFLEGAENNIHLKVSEFACDEKEARRILYNDCLGNGYVPLHIYSEEELENKRKEWLSNQF